MGLLYASSNSKDSKMTLMTSFAFSQVGECVPSLWQRRRGGKVPTCLPKNAFSSCVGYVATLSYLWDAAKDDAVSDSLASNNSTGLV